MINLSWVGKLVGGLLGLLLSRGNPLVAALGVFIGHQFDKGFAKGTANTSFGAFTRASAAERQRIYLESVFLAMGCLAKADGRVSEEEIQIARSRMHRLGLGPEEVRIAIDLFNRGKQADFPIEQQMQKLAASCRGQPDLTRNFFGFLLDIPLSRGRVKPAERDLLARLAASLGIGRVEMVQIEALLRAQHSFRQGAPRPPSEAAELDEAYKALGITATATDKQVKTAYRRLMNQHHPDKLASRGLPDSMLEVAKERTREIRAAYEKIRDKRGMR
jgi:DnaJ like chaperone protein